MEVGESWRAGGGCGTRVAMLASQLATRKKQGERALVDLQAACIAIIVSRHAQTRRNAADESASVRLQLTIDTENRPSKRAGDGTYLWQAV